MVKTNTEYSAGLAACWADKMDHCYTYNAWMADPAVPKALEGTHCRNSYLRTVWTTKGLEETAVHAVQAIERNIPAAKI